MRLLRRPAWSMPEREATPEPVYARRGVGRRDILRALGLGALSLGAATLPPARRAAAAPSPPADPRIAGFVRNPRYPLDRPLTDEHVAGRYNNYYEFTMNKEGVAGLAAGFPVRPWTVTVAGLCRRPRTWDLDALARAVPLEERLYRHRCVEAWSMAVPWIGLPLAKFLALHDPLSSARYVRFVSLMAPDQMPGQKSQPWYPWPYFEGLSLPEAMNELPLLVTGVYGKPLPPQLGAPLRLAVPWKYGYKSPKAIVRIEFVAQRPPTFWSQLAPDEYGFVSNVDPRPPRDPHEPHARWSQATERVIDTDEHRPTLLYNGYGAFVAGLYP